MQAVMLRLGLWSMLAWLLGASSLAAADPAYRVLFLGNSIFKANGGSPQQFLKFCETAGIEAEAESPPERIDPFVRNQANDPKIAALIRKGRYTHVVLATRLGDFLDDRERAAAFIGFKKLHAIIVASGARTVISMSYPTRDEKRPYDKVRQGHEDLLKQLNAMKVGGTTYPILLVPVGALWVEARGQFGDAAWYSDDLHGKPLAQFANGCLWYTYLIGNDPHANAWGERHPECPWIKQKVWDGYKASVATDAPD